MKVYSTIVWVENRPRPPSVLIILGATAVLVQIFWAIVLDRAENLGEGLEPQVNNVE